MEESSASLPPFSSVSSNSLQKQIETCIEEWSCLDLSQKQKELQDWAQKIANTVDSSANSRQNLVQETKKFQKGSEDEKQRHLPSLIKMYQQEIDHLRDRALFAEKAVLSTFADFASIGDPASILSAAVSEIRKIQQFSELEQQNQKLHKDSVLLNSELSQLKDSQKKLKVLEEETRSLKANFDELLEKRIHQVSNQLIEKHVEELECEKTIQVQLRDQLQQVERELAKSKEQQDQHQSIILEIRSESEVKSNSLQSEIDLLSEENTKLCNQLSQLKQESDKFPQLERDHQNRLKVQLDLELQLAQKELEIRHLCDSLELSEKEKSVQVQSLSSLNALLEQQLTSKVSSPPSFYHYLQIIKKKSIPSGVLRCDQRQMSSLLWRKP